ncbi:hypothetical protein [Isoalcanivorax indicus]|uniref:hypothetical protein n=1 Tax=Isoalcanivorax indicus TaxID=2202653 RepID=UPI0013C44A4F|nr:hypothetical protein [Isoalcanivorax indicus]
MQPVSQDTPRQHAAPASWPRAWRSLWLLLILPGLLSAGTARALDLDGPAGQHSVDIPTLAVVRDLPGHLLTSPPHEADDTPAIATAPAARHTLPQRGAVPLPAAPTLARHLERHPGHPRAPPALI